MCLTSEGKCWTTYRGLFWYFQIQAGKASSVFIPIIPEIIGMAELSVRAQSFLSADAVNRQLKVEAEGSPMHFNVPLLLNENNPTDIPLALPDNVVPDSQKVQVSAIGMYLR